MYRNVLVPTDGSAGAERAATHAEELATTCGATLHVVSIVDTGAVPPDVRADAILEESERRCRTAVETIAERAETAGVTDVRRSVLRGHPVQQLLTYVDDNDVDLVVMGTHGRTGLRRVLVGSVTEAVLRRADVPVLAVPGGMADE